MIISFPIWMALLSMRMDNGREQWLLLFPAMTPSAIRRIFDNTRKYKVYSVEGVMVKDGITADKFSELPRGIYIIDGQKVIIE